MKLVLVSGLSGSGKSIALHQIEDSGFYCIDNLPTKFLVDVVKHLASIKKDRVAVALDVRSDFKLAEVIESSRQLKEMGVEVQTLSLTASTPVLVKRYSETRRQHPLSRTGDFSQTTLLEAIEKEREMLAPILSRTHLIDTSGMHPSTLKNWVSKFINAKDDKLVLTIESFGFKNGVPIASDFVFDVRCLPNPYWEKELRPFTGLQEPIINYLESKSEVKAMVDDIAGFLEKWLPKFREQDRHYVTCSIGCTGGQHRSVYVADQLGKIFSKFNDTVIVRHRTLDV